MTTTALAHDQRVTEPTTVRHRFPFLRHFLAMVLAMVGGMMVFGGLVYGGLSLAGVDDSQLSAELDSLMMVFTMSVGMTIWMRYRGHGWSGVLEMDAAMFVPFLALFPLFWLDAISADAMYGLAHLLMLPVMLVVMLRHRHDYVHA
jgi:flagellar biosynthetic protein FliP